MKNKNKIYLLAVLSVLILIVIVVSVSFKISKENDSKKSLNEEVGFEGPQTPPPANLIPDLSTEDLPKNSVIENKDLRPMIEIMVGDVGYKAPIKIGETLKETMDLYQSQNDNFTFSGKEMQGVGFFVDEINGVKNSDGLFWVYYVNDVSATLGISSLRLSGGEVIRWERRVPGDY